MQSPILFHGQFAACLHFSGADAFSFVQSQWTARLPPPDASCWARGLWLNARGRVLAECFAWAQAPDSVLIWSYDCPTTHLLSAVQMNLIADHVEIEDMTGRLFASWIPSKWASIIDCLKELPIPTGFKVHGNDEAVLCSAGEGAGARLLVIAEPSVHRQLQEAVREADPEVVFCAFDTQARHLLRILHGIPAVPQDLGSLNLPHEGNVPTSWIAMNKGCFPGREILANFHKTGKLAKSVIRFRIADIERPSVIELPLPVYSGTMEVGTITSLASERDCILGLAMVRTRHQDKPLTMRNADGSVHLLELIHGQPEPAA